MPQSKENFDKNTVAIIYYLIEHLDGVLGKTHLQKMLFLIDLLSTKKFKEPLTKLNFQRYHYGPYSEEVNNYISRLETKEQIIVKVLPFSDNEDKTYTRYYYNNKGSIKNYLYKELGAEKVMLIDEIINSFGNKSLQEVLDVVYSLETIKKADLCKPLEMAQIIKDEENNDEPVEELDIF